VAGRREAAEAWWPLIARVLAFLIGAVIVLYATFMPGVPFFLVIGGFGLLGPVGLEVAALMLKRKGNSDE
jgi:hypothetical protein